MFENIIGHGKIVSLLSCDLSGGSLPNSLLFYGPRFSGKLSAALELSRVLCCEKDARWGCKCRSCYLNRTLMHPNVLMLGARYFELEIAACADVLRGNPRESSQYLYIRSVRKLTRRFDPIIWDGEGGRIQKVRESIQKTEEMLRDLIPPRSLPDTTELENTLDKIRKQVDRITAGFISDNIPIFQIRNIRTWAHLTSSGYPKIVILENAEKMQDGSRNALLKILEEPPENVFFILLSQKRQEVIPTILSRLRPYHFMERNEASSREILKRIFKVQGDEFRNLRDYFLIFRNIHPGVLRSTARKYLYSIFKRDHYGAVDLSEVSDHIVARGAFSLFLYELTTVMREILHRKDELFSEFDPEIQTLNRWKNLVDEVREQHEIYNVSASLLLESLFYGMQERT